MKPGLTKMSIMIALVAAIVLPSCSKKDKNDEGSIGDNVKTATFTIKVTGGNAKVLSVIIGGANTRGATSTWKLNGTEVNDAAIMLDQNDFPGTTAKTYTTVLVQPANNVSMHITGETPTSGTPYKIYYKCEVNGVKKDEATVDVTAANGFSKSLRYTE